MKTRIPAGGHGVAHIRTALVKGACLPTDSCQGQRRDMEMSDSAFGIQAQVHDVPGDRARSSTAQGTS